MDGERGIWVRSKRGGAEVAERNAEKMGFWGASGLRLMEKFLTAEDADNTDEAGFSVGRGHDFQL
jgi:hypothetical protein